MNTTNMNISKRYDENGMIIGPFVREGCYIALGLQWLNSVLIITLNTAVIVTILRYKKKSRFYFLLLNIAIADLTTGLIDALVNAIERTLGLEYLNYWWFGGDFFCKLQRTLGSTSLCASNFILAATSVDRALVVAKPMLSFKRGYALQKVLIITCWLLSAAASGPFIAFNSLEFMDIYYMIGVQHVPQCDVKIDWKTLFYLMLIIYVLLPLTVIIVSYCILIYFIFKRARALPNGNHGADNLRIFSVFNKGLPRTKARSIKLTFGIVLSFIAAWSPFFVILYLHLFHNYHDPVVMFFITTFYWNCSVNPVIFFAFHRRRPTSASPR